MFSFKKFTPHSCMIVALVYNTVTGARGDKAGENTAALMKTGAIVGGCIGAFTVV